MDHTTRNWNKINWRIGILVTTLLTIPIAIIPLKMNIVQLFDQTDNTAIALPPISTVTGLGRLEPQEKIIKLAAPITSESNRIEKLLVKEGDYVQANQIIAILDNHEKLTASVLEAQQKLKVAQANLQKVLAGAKNGEVQAQTANINRLVVEQSTDIEAQKALITRLEAEQQAQLISQQATIDRIQAEQQGLITAQQTTIDRIQAELDNAQLDQQRHETLYEAGAISLTILENYRLKEKTTYQRLLEAKANLTKIELTTQQQITEAQAKYQEIKLSREQQIKEAQAKLNQILSAKNQQIKEAQGTFNRIVEIRPEDVTVANAEVQ